MDRHRWPRDDIDFGDGPIQVRVATVEQLFSPMDPSPLADRSLDPAVADWIEEWADDIDRRHPLDVEIHVADGRLDDREAAIATAIQSHFEYRAWQLSRELRKVIRDGRVSLVIGLAALAGFTTLSRVIADSTDPVIDVAHEGVAVLGWVSMWKPLEMLLYEWWPIRRERRACRRIADATISFPVETSPG